MLGGIFLQFRGNVRICSQFLTCNSSAAQWLDDQARLLQEMSLFSSANVKRGYAIRPEDIPILTKTYRLNSEQVVAEFVDFCQAFKRYHIQLRLILRQSLTCS